MLEWLSLHFVTSICLRKKRAAASGGSLHPGEKSLVGFICCRTRGGATKSLCQCGDSSGGVPPVAIGGDAADSMGTRASAAAARL